MAIPDTGIPRPPEEALEEPERPVFLPSPELEAWVRGAFLNPRSGLCNPEHAHLDQARIGYLWTNTPLRRNMRDVVGMAELAKAQGHAWVRARAELQLLEWFGEPPDFLITLYAPYWAAAPDLAFCAGIEHELYHCAQKLDFFGCPAFGLDGNPVWGIRGHDAEEFVGVVRRYGAGPAAGGVREIAAAAALEPEIGEADVRFACGTCLRA